MQLVSITSKEESDRIKKQAKDEGNLCTYILYAKMQNIMDDCILSTDFLSISIGQDYNFFWTSGTKLGFDSWQWMGIGKQVKFTDWSTGEPNNLKDSNENCIHLYGASSKEAGRWNDVPCDCEYYFICEEEQVEYEYCSN